MQAPGAQLHVLQRRIVLGVAARMAVTEQQQYRQQQKLGQGRHHDPLHPTGKAPPQLGAAIGVLKTRAKGVGLQEKLFALQSLSRSVS